MKDFITSDDILGKDVVDVDGELLGVTQQLRIEKQSKQVHGILVDQGFMRPDLYVGIGAIRNFGRDSVFLNKSPTSKLKGLLVLDKNAKEIGHIIDVEEQGNRLQAVYIKRRTFGKRYKIPADKIQSVGFSVRVTIAGSDIFND